MTRRDTPQDKGSATDPGDAPEGAVDDALGKLDGTLPQYVVSRAQSDQADAARHHVEPKSPPRAADVVVGAPAVEIAKGTDPGIGPASPTPPAPNESITAQIERARGAPPEQLEPEDWAALDALRAQRGAIGGVETDPSARKLDERRRVGVIIVVAAALLVATAILALGRGKNPPSTNEAASATTTTTSEPSAVAPPKTAPTPVETVSAPTATATPSPTPSPGPSSAPTVRPTATARASATVTPPATTAAPTQTGPDLNPLIEHDF